jgi:hypothetical protein
LNANVRIFSISLIIILLCIACASSYQNRTGIQRISSEAILDQLRNSSTVIYDNVEIYGDLDLTNLNQPSIISGDIESGQSQDIIDSPINIANSKFKGDIRFGDKIFNGPLMFNNNIILGVADFKGSSFKNETRFNGFVFDNSVDFSKSHFYKDISFKNCIFKKDCSFIRSIFEKNASFKDTDFFDDVLFVKAVFKGDATFENSTIYQGITNFRDTSFTKSANIVRSKFEGEETKFSNAEFGGPANLLGSSFMKADFIGSKFNGETKIVNAFFYGNTCFNSTIFNRDVAFFSAFIGNVAFDKLQFKQEASFRRALFKESAIFDEAEFGKRAQFSDAKFNGLTSFNGSQFNGDALFEDAQLNGTLFLNRAKYDKFYIRWHNIKDLGYDDSAYLLLIENFKKLGFWSDADECYFAYRSECNKYLPTIYRPVDWILSILYGYGTRPERPLFWFIAAIIIFGLIFYKIGGVHKDNKKISFMDSIYFSAANIASGTSTFGNFVSEPKDFQAVGKFQYLVIIEKFLGMLIFALFLAALARTVIR